MPGDLSQWVPERMRWADAGPVVDWIHTGGQRFTDPFFEDTLRRLSWGQTAGAGRCQTSMGELETWVSEHPGLPPAGFVFHLSRSGSTLISQMLAALETNRAISEAPALDDLLRLEFRRPELGAEQLACWLRAMVGALGQPVNHAESRYFVKWDCWHTRQLPLIRRAFPQTPWIFLYRDPLEVLVSQMSKPGWWTVRGALETAVTDGADWQAGREDHCARVLAGICRAAIDQGAVLVNYTELPEAVPHRLAAHFGVEFSVGEQQQMRAAACFDAKNPRFAFAADSEAKRRAASPRVMQASARWLDGLYQELEQLRTSGHGLPGSSMSSSYPPRDLR